MSQRKWRKKSSTEWKRQTKALFMVWFGFDRQKFVFFCFRIRQLSIFPHMNGSRHHNGTERKREKWNMAQNSLSFANTTDASGDLHFIPIPIPIYSRFSIGNYFLHLIHEGEFSKYVFYLVFSHFNFPRISHKFRRPIWQGRNEQFIYLFLDENKHSPIANQMNVRDEEIEKWKLKTAWHSPESDDTPGKPSFRNLTRFGGGCSSIVTKWLENKMWQEL